MTSRDRIVLMVLAVFALMGAGWVLAVSPKRKEANKLETQVSAAKAQLATASDELSHAHAAQAQYAAAYASIVSLGKAVPASQEVPSLIYQLSRASNQKNVDFNSIAATSTGGAGAGSTPASASAGSATSGATGAPAVTAGFSQMPFTFVFDGSFFDLEHLFHRLNGFTVRSASGGLQVSGRLLTIQSVKLAPVATQQAGQGPSSELTGTVTATAYVLPAGQGLTGGATPSSPSSTTAVSSTSGASGSPTAPAVAQVTP
jgi:Type II secretion system (T2SS), protein M